MGDPESEWKKEKKRSGARQAHWLRMKKCLPDRNSIRYQKGKSVCLIEQSVCLTKECLADRISETHNCRQNRKSVWLIKKSVCLIKSYVCVKSDQKSVPENPASISCGPGQPAEQCVPGRDAQRTSKSLAQVGDRRPQHTNTD